jgi:hypothetical protein
MTETDSSLRNVMFWIKLVRWIMSKKTVILTSDLLFSFKDRHLVFLFYLYVTVTLPTECQDIVTFWKQAVDLIHTHKWAHLHAVTHSSRLSFSHWHTQSLVCHVLLTCSLVYSSTNSFSHFHTHYRKQTATVSTSLRVSSVWQEGTVLSFRDSVDLDWGTRGQPA